VKAPAILLAALSLFIPLLLTPPQTFAQSAPGAFSQSPLEQQIVAKEREGLEALKTGNLDAFADLTGQDAVFVDAHGSATKAEVMKNVAGFKLTDFTMEDMKFVALSRNSGLINYKISEIGVSHGKEFTAKAYVSSIWAKRGSHWLCLFSQETAVR
jgi:hypothetical protein